MNYNGKFMKIQQKITEVRWMENTKQSVLASQDLLLYCLI